MTKEGQKRIQEKNTRGEGCLLFDGEINRQNQDSQEEQLKNRGMPDREKNSRGNQAISESVRGRIMCISCICK